MNNSRLFSLIIAERLPIRVSFFRKFALLTVTVLTAAILAGCSTLNLNNEERCNSRAYVRTPLESFVKQRFPYGAPVRLGIIPFATPENFAARSDQMPGAGKLLARHLQREFLHRQRSATIVEIMNRSDWPGQAEEFYHGNYRSLSMARDAGYDLVLVGVVENPRSVDELSAFGKLIEVASGITIWNGRGIVNTNRNDRKTFPPSSWWLADSPKQPETNLLLEHLAECLAGDALHEDPFPE